MATPMRVRSCRLWIATLVFCATYSPTLLGGCPDFFLAPTYRSSLQATSMAAADLNGDGKTDVVLTQGEANSVTVLLAGPGGLQPGGTLAVGRSPSMVRTSDFNGDGRIDLAVVNVESADVSILLGLGDGTFQSAVTYSTGAAPPPFVLRAASLAVADFNHDGKPDIAASHVASINRTVTIMIGTGTGTFDFGLPAVSDIGGPIMIAADVTNDGEIDLVMDGREYLLIVHAGNGDLTFRAKAEYAAPRHLSDLVAADFNRDGLMDLALTDSGGFSVFILSGMPGSSFSAPVPVPAGNYPTSLATGDFNHDGKSDLVTANSNSGDISVLLGDGLGAFSPEKSYSASRARLLALGDANADGATDVFVANHAESPHVSILAGDGLGGFGSARTFRAGFTVDDAVPFDLDADGFPDLAVPNGYSGTLSILRNLRDGSFSDFVPYIVGGFPYAVAAGDLNGDTREDVVVTGALEGSTGFLAVLINMGGGALAPPAVRTLPGRGFDLGVSDFNLDGNQDVVVTLLDGESIAVLLGQGDGTFGGPVTHPVGFRAPYVDHGDLDGDGDPDLAVRRSDSGVAILMNSGGGTFSAAAITSASGIGDLALMDLNSDARADLVTADLDAGTITVFGGKGDGTFDMGATFPGGYRPHNIRSGDFSGDGFPDLLVANRNQGFSLLQGTDRSTFGPPATYVIGAAGTAAAADFDQDGRLDVAISNIHRVVIVLNRCEPSPIINSIRPPYGLTAGGETIEISGLNLANVTSVLFGGTEAAVTLRSGNRVMAIAPAHSAGSVTVSVISSGGTAAHSFLYIAAVEDIPALSRPVLVTLIGAIAAITMWRLRQP
jgi:hypothetical protein